MRARRPRREYALFGATRRARIVALYNAANGFYAKPDTFVDPSEEMRFLLQQHERFGDSSPDLVILAFFGKFPTP